MTNYNTNLLPDLPYEMQNQIFHDLRQYSLLRNVSKKHREEFGKYYKQHTCLDLQVSAKEIIDILKEKDVIKNTKSLLNSDRPVTLSALGSRASNHMNQNIAKVVFVFLNDKQDGMVKGDIISVTIRESIVPESYDLTYPTIETKKIKLFDVRSLMDVVINAELSEYKIQFFGSSLMIYALSKRTACVELYQDQTKYIEIFISQDIKKKLDYELKDDPYLSFFFLNMLRLDFDVNSLLQYLNQTYYKLSYFFDNFGNRNYMEDLLDDSVIMFLINSYEDSGFDIFDNEI
jgi:hypothetical protein